MESSFVLGFQTPSCLINVMSLMYVGTPLDTSGGERHDLFLGRLCLL